jgi:Protein of unknown function (DUF1295)/Flavin containing amine oxidoreductase
LVWAVPAGTATPAEAAPADPMGRPLRIPNVETPFGPARSVAVIGSDVAGLTAAYVLSGRDRVTLYEADTRLGGHTHTHFVGDGTVIGVDSAFLAHNARTYPTLCRLFAELGVRTQESDMSMSVCVDDIGLEYAEALGVRGLFASWLTLRPRYLQMLAEITRFHPNYLGDVCVWWGLWLITITGWPALATLLSPLLMTYFLVYASGARGTEKYMAGRPGFDEYQQRTSFFVARSPRSANR